MRRFQSALWSFVVFYSCGLPEAFAQFGFEPQVGQITGTDVAVFPFEVTAPFISFEATLTDLQSPAPFQYLGLGITTEDNPNTFLNFAEAFGPLGAINLNFDVNPGRYLALVGGIADADA